MANKKTSILLVSSDQGICLIIDAVCDGYDLMQCDSMREAKRRCASSKPDIVLIDADLPDGDGVAFVAELRKWAHMPIILISDRSDDKSILRSFDAGADDHVIAPFNGDILLARIKATVRRSVVRDVGEPFLMHGPIKMDLVRHEVEVDGQIVSMTPKEYDLLRYLILNRGRMLTHKQILKEVWGPAHTDDTQYLRVYISQVRDKLGGPDDIGGMIRAESGVGYILEEQPGRKSHKRQAPPLRANA